MSSLWSPVVANGGKRRQMPGSADLDESFFRVRMGRATRAELAYLAAMAHLGSGP